MLMRISYHTSHRQKMKKQPGAWASTIPGKSLGYEVTGFTWGGVGAEGLVFVCVYMSVHMVMCPEWTGGC